MHARNDSFSSYDYGSFRHLQAVSPRSSHEIIIIASHHKTGTILSQKIFARVCAIMKWCCVFHVTKDSLVAVKHSLANEPVKLMGHTQWAWNPSELGVPYRFVHFYRDPYKKVASGYRYHLDGVEAWCKKPLYYPSACKLPDRASATKRQVFEFCQSVHLCEPCCRLEHEARYAHHHAASALHHSHTGGADVVYSARPESEYAFVCKHLSGINVSLTDALQNSVSLEEALRIEASIDFYENLRMARIVNSTWNDPHSLNIDLDDFMGSYETSVRMILHHLNLQLPASDMEEIVSELNFYDIENSPIYRYSQSNPLMNHINQEATDEKIAIKEILAHDTTLRTFYKPIIDLMDVALKEVRTSVGAKNALRKIAPYSEAVQSRYLRYLHLPDESA